MKRNLSIMCVLLIAILAAACGARAVPEWKRHSFNYLERFKHYYLTGDRQKADLYFDKSVEEIRKSGNLTILSRAYLTQCSLMVAVLIPSACFDFNMIDAIDPDPVHRNFYLFLSGDLDTLDADMLPRRYARVSAALLSGAPAEVNVALGKIDDPLSRMISAGVAVSLDLFDESTLNIALETASEQGWKLALLRYLEKLKYLYEQDGNTARAAYIKAKIQCITDTR